MRSGEGSGQRLCLHVLQQPAASPQIKDQAGQLWSGLKTMLPPEQLVALEARVRVAPFEVVIAELLRRNRDNGMPDDDR